MQLTGLIVQLASKFYQETCMRRKQDRRQFLMKGDMAHYQLSVRATQARLIEYRRLVAKRVVSEWARIDEKIWNKSAEYYTGCPVLGRQLQAIIQIFPYKHMEIKGERYNELKKHEMYE